MSIEIPGWLRWVGDMIGEDFPEGDEDKVWAQAERWKHFADQLEAQRFAIDNATRNTLNGFAAGEAHDTMRTEFATLTSGDASLDVLVQQLRDLSDAVDRTGTEIEFAKEMYIANLAILAATLTALIASAWINWGAPAEGAAAVAATEFTISQIIRAAIAKVVEAGASKIITQLALRALQGAAINAVISGGLNAGIQGLQMLQGHRRDFDGQSLLNDVKGGAIAGAVMGPLIRGGMAVDTGSVLGNRLTTFGASFVGNTGGSLAAQQALTGHVNFGDAAMSGLIYGGIDGVHPSVAARTRISADPLVIGAADGPKTFGGDEAPAVAATAERTATPPEGGAGRAANVDRPLNLGTREPLSTPDGVPAAASRAESAAAAPGTSGSVARGGEVAAAAHPGRADAPVAPASSTSAAAAAQSTTAPAAARAGVAPAPGGHVATAGEPAARVAESAPARASTTPTAEPSAGRHAAPEPAAAEPNRATHNASESGRSADAVRSDHSGERWQGAARDADPAHSRAVADHALVQRLSPAEPEGLHSPHQNAEWWNGLTGDEQRALIDTYPRDIGNAHGLPPAARHEANVHSIAHEREQLRSRQEGGERLTRHEQKYLNRLDAIDDALQAARRQAEEAGVGGPRILAFDPNAFGGDGRAIVAFGDDPYRAESVSWHVPGLTTTIDSLGTNMTNAMNHLQSTRLEHSGISAASIAWIGYNAPSGLGSWRVAFHGLAREGGDLLHGDITAFNAGRDLHAGDGSHFTNNHVFGHSYGSTATSYAGEGGRLHDQVTTVTLLGSPGAGPHRSADGFGIGRENVFVASSSRDWVTTLGGRDSGGRFLGHFGLGRDPAMDTWGGRRITSEFPVGMDTMGTVGTHTAYYHHVEGPTGTHPGVRSESLANFGRIAAGHPERLDLEQHRHEVDRHWRPGLRTEEPAAGRPLRLDEGGSGREYSVERRAFDPRWHRGDDGPPDGGSHRPTRLPDDDHDGGGSDQHIADDAGSVWDGPAGEHAAALLPTDDSGYRLQPRDCEFLGITPEQVEVWASREAPLGMSPNDFREFSDSLHDALVRDGFPADAVDVRLQGSSARFFSGEHKELPQYGALHDDAEAQSRMSAWFGDDDDHPLRRPFDSMYRLGLDPEPSDYDIQVSSDAMVDACRQRWEANGAQGQLINTKYGFVDKKIFAEMFPSLWAWANEWTERTGREVVPALFPGGGPPDTSASGVSSHFRAWDWVMHRGDTETP